MRKTESDERTLAQQIFEGKQLLVERPPEMPFNLYRELLRIQTRILKDLFRRCPDRRLAGLMGARSHSTLPTTAKGFRHE
jgi:hypothetical protein